MMMRKFLLFIVVVFLCTNAFSQGHTEDFNDGDTVGWWNQADYSLKNTGADLEVISKKVSAWNGFTYSFSAIDITANPYVSIKLKTDTDFNLNFFINADSAYAGGGGSASNYQEIVRSENFVEYTFDFSGVTKVDFTEADILNFVFNPGGTNTCSATVVIDDIKIGAVARVMPATTRPQDQFHVMNTPEITVPLWGILQRKSGAVSISATSSNPSLIPNPVVAYTSPNTTGSLSYTPVADMAGVAEITVTVTEVGADDNVFSFFVNVEKNLAPIINQANDINIKAGAVTDITILGLADGNPNANQKLTITAASSDVSIMPDPEISYEYGSFNGVVRLSPISGKTGKVTITVTVKDDGGILNNGVDTSIMTFDAIVYADVNNAPIMNNPVDVSILENSAEHSTLLKEISDGDKSKVQNVDVTAVSSNPTLIPNPTVDYTLGAANGRLLYTPIASQTGVATITVTLKDNGGTGINNGDESTVYTFDIEVRVAPIVGWSDDFEDGVLGSQWPAVWGDLGDPGEGTHLCTELEGSMKIQIDKTRTNGRWSGLWFNIPNELDLSENPYISIRMKMSKTAGTTDDMHIFLWDAYEHYNTAKTIKHKVTGEYVEYFFDYTDPSYQLQGDGTPVDISRIKALLFNFDPGGDSPLLQGSFYFDDLRIGDEAHRENVILNVTMDNVPDFAVVKDASVQTVELTGLADGGNGSNAVSIEVASSNTSLVSAPTVSDVIDGSATLTYTPVAGQMGNTIITVTASATGSVDSIQTFTIDVMDVSAAAAEKITIDMTKEYQEIDGFGAYMGSGATSTETVINLARDMGMSMARIGLVGGGFEEVNDNSDPYTINLDAFNPSAFSLDNIRNIAPFVDKFILTIWSPAGWMKTNKTELGVNHGATDNTLEPRYYEEYAEEVIAAIQIIKRETGVELYAIGLHNEPQFNEPYASCKMDWNQYRDVLKVVGKRLDDEGLGHIQLFFAEALPAQGNLDEYMDAVKNDPIAEGYADIAALHNYDSDGSSVGGAGCSGWADFYSRATSGGTGSKYKTWMTETSGHPDTWDGAMTLAGNIFNALECGNVSAWLFWTLSESASSPEYGLILNNIPTSRYYVSKQFYKYIRPGAKRVDVAYTGVPAVAFKDTVNGLVSVVLFNNTDLPKVIEVGGADLPAKWEAYTTSNSRNFEKVDNVGADGLIILPPSSLTTLVGYDNFPPSIDAVSDINLLMNSPEQTVSLTGIDDGEDGNQNLTIKATSDNTALISHPAITYENGESIGELIYTPINGKSGSATITITLTDDGDPVREIVKQFVVDVKILNVIPQIDDIDDVIAYEDGALQTVNLTGINDGNEGVQDLTIQLSGYNADLITASLNYIKGATEGTIDYRPKADTSGVTTITVTLQDDGGVLDGGVDKKEITFDVTVNAVNDQPKIDIVSTYTSTVATLEKISLTGIDDGDDEVQNIIITATSDALDVVPELIVNYLSGDDVATLEFTPISRGIANALVTVSDNGGVLNGGVDKIEISIKILAYEAVGVGDNSLKTVILYPNPTSDFVNVVINSNRYNSMVIYNTMGKVIATNDISSIVGEFKFDVSGYTKGTYTIVLVDGNGRYSSKFIVE